MHLAYEKKTKKKFAIKFLKKHDIIKNKEIEHVHNEFYVSEQVKHPFWARVLGYDQDDKYIYMI